MYNNIYVNNSDDTTVINAKPIEIDTILNNKFVARIVLKKEANLLKKYELGLIKDFDKVLFVLIS